MSKEIRPKVLWHSVAPFIRSGYGNITKNILTRLADHGFDIICSAYYGVDPGGIMPYKFPILSSKEGPFGILSAQKHARQFGVDMSILATDWWAFSDFPKIMPNPVGYVPMDHTNYSDEILEFTKLYRRIISLCKWQQDYLKSEGIESDMIYHGVDTSLFKPLNKEECRKKFGIQPHQFCIGTVAANSDKESRKGWTYAIKAVHHFLESHPDVKREDIVWMCHTNSTDQRGMPLNGIARKFKVDDVMKFMDPSQCDLMIGEADLVQLMNAFDVHLMPSKREGFGLTALETMSCGVPNIGHNFSALIELIQGHGWLAKSLGTGLNLETTAINGETGVPDVYSVAECLEEAFFKEDLRLQYGKESRKFALQFNWDDIVVNEWVPVLNRLLEEKCVDDRKLL